MAENVHYWGAVILIIVIIFCLMGIDNALKQNTIKVRWMSSVESRLRTCAANNKEYAQELAVLNNQPQGLSADEVKALIMATQQTTAYNHLAGCYGIVPKDERWFNLTCDQQFNFR